MLFIADGMSYHLRCAAVDCSRQLAEIDIFAELRRRLMSADTIFFGIACWLPSHY